MYGSDRCLYELLKRIDKKQFVPVLVLPFEGELSEKLRSLGISIYIIDPWVLRKGVFHSIGFVSYLLKLPISVFRIIRLIKKERISVVYSNTSVILGSPLAAFITHRPHICHIRELYDNYPRLSPFYSLFLCLFSRKIIAISKTAASFVQKSCSGKSTVVYDGITLERFTGTTGKIPGELLEWKQQKRIIISNIGRISRIKGQELFIDAARKCVNYASNLGFLIIGGVFQGNEIYMSYLQEMVTANGMKNVMMFTGFRDDVDDFIRNSDIIVLSTLISEGLGQVVMEGMAAGKVVIAPDKGGPPELIEHGIDGILYSAGNRDALAQAILKMAGDPTLRNSIGQKARYNAEKKFGIQSNIDAIEQIIKEAAFG